MSEGHTTRVYFLKASKHSNKGDIVRAPIVFVSVEQIRLVLYK